MTDRGHRHEQAKVAARAQAARERGGAVEAIAPFLGTGFYRWLVGGLLVGGAPLLGALTSLCWCPLRLAVGRGGSARWP